MELDGQFLSGATMRVPLVDDGKSHTISAVLGSDTTQPSPTD
jgi:hypothetical protein